MPKKKKGYDPFEGVLDTLKVGVGVGAGSVVVGSLMSSPHVPSAVSRNVGTSMGMLGAVPLVMAGGTVLRSLRTFEDLDLDF